jgi:hypothetical protein
MVDQAQVDAMSDVLKKLKSNVDTAAQGIVTESKKNPDLGFAVEAQRTDERSVSVSRYTIQAEEKTLTEGLSKNFYNVVDTQTNEIVAADLGLFESAMGVVKHLLYTNKVAAVDKIINLDSVYLSAMTEAYAYKKRMSRLDESTATHDVAAAKYSQAKQKLASAKMRILKTL